MRALFILLAGAALLSAQSDTILHNATVHTITKGTFKGSVLIRDGKIAEVGERIMTPPGARVIDATGKHIMPGIIDAHTHIASDSTNEGTLSVTSMVEVGDVINPESKDIYRALAGGVTTANILHGSANSIGGENVILKMRWGTNVAGLLFKEAPPSLKMALGENVKRSGMGGNFPMQGVPQNLRYPGTRMGVEDVIRESFTRAREYQKEWKEYEGKKARGESALPPRRDLALDPLVEVLEGKRLVHVHAYRSDEILMILRVAEDFGFKIAGLEHGLEAYKVAKEVAAAGAGVSTFSDWWSYKVEAWDAIPYNAAILQKKGVLVSLNSDDAGGAELMRRLNTEAAKIVKYGGVTEDEALAMITINPAKQLHIDKYVGSVEAGKQADLVIFDKHPLSSYSRVEKVFIDGKLYFDREKDIEERPKQEATKKALTEKEREAEKRATPQSRRPS